MTEKPQFVSYLRVSTDKQGKSGLGIEAQRASVKEFVAGRGGEIIAPEYVEKESGKKNDRPELAKAMLLCRKTGATLVVAKLDRLSRNAAFLLTLKDSGVTFVAADCPEANTMTVGIMAVMAQYERECTVKRTVDALAIARTRRTAIWTEAQANYYPPPVRLLGGYRAKAADISKYQKRGAKANEKRAEAAAELVRDDIEPLAQKGLSLRGIAAELNTKKILTPKSRILFKRHKLNDQTRKPWSAQGVANVIERLNIKRPTAEASRQPR